MSDTKQIVVTALTVLAATNYTKSVIRKRYRKALAAERAQYITFQNKFGDTVTVHADYYESFVRIFDYM